MGERDGRKGCEAGMGGRGGAEGWERRMGETDGKDGWELGERGGLLIPDHPRHNRVVVGHGGIAAGATAAGPVEY